MTFFKKFDFKNKIKKLVYTKYNLEASQFPKQFQRNGK